MSWSNVGYDIFLSYFFHCPVPTFHLIQWSLSRVTIPKRLNVTAVLLIAMGKSWNRPLPTAITSAHANCFSSVMRKIISRLRDTSAKKNSYLSFRMKNSEEKMRQWFLTHDIFAACDNGERFSLSSFQRAGRSEYEVSRNKPSASSTCAWVTGRSWACRSQRSERKVHREFGVFPGNGWVIDPTNEATPRSKLVEKTAI